MARYRDRSGEKIGRLFVVGQATKDPRTGNVRWLCRCDCGNEKLIPTSNLAGNKSCGCLRSEHITAVNIAGAKHGHARSGGGNKRLTSPEYNSWRSMLDRVNRPNAINYHLYGGRGIKVCERWQGTEGFSNFLADMGPRPSKNHTLDREDNDGNYEPDNCRWATKKQQRINQRDTPELQAIRRESLRRGLMTQRKRKSI